MINMTHILKMNRRGFSMVELVVAGFITALMLGGVFLMNHQGTKSFQVVTEHASFRQEALLCMEYVARDMEELMVSSGPNPILGSTSWSMTSPFVLSEPVTVDGQELFTRLDFFRYHHTGNTVGEDGDGIPQLVARRITYQCRTSTTKDGHRITDLLRNGQKINHQPLALVNFEPVAAVVAAQTIGGAPQAILKINVLPRGGMWGTMKDQSLQQLREKEGLVSRTIHLVGYESQYTSLLFVALQKFHRAQLSGIKPVFTPLQRAVYEDALAHIPARLYDIEQTLGSRPPPAFELSEEVTRLEDVAYTDEDSHLDGEFSKATLSTGRWGQVPDSGTLGALERAEVIK
jgi:hypothetical protein